MTRLTRDAYGLLLAEAAASRADCTRRQVGAVIVAEDGSVVATGYNGLASGLPGCASAGACPRGQMAYPSEPQDCPACQGDGGWTERVNEGSRETVWVTCSACKGSCEAPTHPADTGYEATGCRAVHAEVNAIIRAGRDRCVGATIYVTDEPCFHCSVVIEGAGLARVVTPSSALIVVPGVGLRGTGVVVEDDPFGPDVDLDENHMEHVPATVPPPSGATGATTPPLCTCPETDPGKRAATYTVARLGMEPHAVTCPRWGTVPPSVSNGGPRTSGPLDPEIHAALVRSVERGRVADLEHEVREDIRADFLNDDGLAPWERS